MNKVGRPVKYTDENERIGIRRIQNKVNLDLPVKLTSSRRFILTSVRRSKLTTYFQY